jgi:hypothetical protein
MERLKGCFMLPEAIPSLSKESPAEYARTQPSETLLLTGARDTVKLDGIDGKAARGCEVAEPGAGFRG